MERNVVIRITIISFVVGFMIAVQYNTVKKPESRDTRDIWEIRHELAEEKRLHSELLNEIASLKKIKAEYEDEDSEEQGKALQSTVDDLRKRAGLTKVTGPGVHLNIQPAEELILSGYKVEPIPPDLLIRLVNEIYRYNGLYIEIDGQRVVHTTAIRDINGRTTVNSVPISNSNVDILIITESFEQAEKLYSYLYASTFRDDFYIDNLKLTIYPAREDITIGAYDGEFTNMYLQKGEGD
ncbi:DUF881 domain-containing protein [Ureibacillus sp. FSL K6-8385]|uniref:DUF881 domain-containing protein n=1 Tax=Ureibacillus terrenus TaxID=118246 RepID=A0A540V489_9BACL|nr:DUF881 domain-containing protein [Ureibacillus terrenus]MED3660318.1 DUF881 domain-containing protein [Ureibacillus terrenus]MED3762474.1 DUF881 domain-containing protein [Ureibacillus terrenus]TQE91544.1 DUF881 domain-containing protein [Ureibacillus terrenus]